MPLYICATNLAAAAAATAREHMSTSPESQMPTSQVTQSAQQSQVVPRGQEQPRGRQSSYLFVDGQQPGTLRQLHFTISPSNSCNPPSVASVTEESSHISGLSTPFGNIQSVMSYQ